VCRTTCIDRENPSTVAQLGPHHHRDQRADPVVGLGQRPTRRLAPTEAIQLLAQRPGFVVGGIDHPVAHPDPLAGRRGQPHRIAGQPPTRLW